MLSKWLVRDSNPAPLLLLSQEVGSASLPCTPATACPPVSYRGLKEMALSHKAMDRSLHTVSQTFMAYFYTLTILITYFSEG